VNRRGFLKALVSLPVAAVSPIDPPGDGYVETRARLMREKASSTPYDDLVATYKDVVYRRTTAEEIKALIALRQRRIR